MTMKRFDREEPQGIAGISEFDRHVLATVQKWAHCLDKGLFSFLRVSFGWSSVIGLVPLAGDLADSILALLVVRTACRIEDGLPVSLKLKMFLNVALDFVVGLVPILGDLADALLKANQLSLHEAWL
ncbi:uncharacterized protein LMH87_007651 [Akanthomyces muscarius]|uniref:DUF4112 domain-containing protein n=1 Tax=Akanthomyces muscarius TaxID=2231603 RepID=A0A9W8UQ06_AKAMU|nr:uncharacterized protein LMH87_007651 [Akanthomyces muscarius]KAJ4161622.1 hypothetical protein LMH87_007651 [Akanthomyces muscarius]